MKTTEWRNPWRVWLNNLSGDLVLARYYLEPVEGKDEVNLRMDEQTHAIYGMLGVGGWLLQNKNDVFFVMPLSIQDQFEFIGEL